MRDPVTNAFPTLSGAFGIAVGELDPDHPGFARVAAVPDAADAVPVPIADGTLCVRVCDVAESDARPDVCGACATCSTDVGTLGFLGLPDILPASDRTFGERTGWCRADCTFDPLTRGDCPAPQTCSPAGICVESCVDDAECQTSILATWDGDRVSVRDPSGPTCDATTGRCLSTRPSDHSVGDACADRWDCAADVGVCLAGGTCGELHCTDAADTEPTGLCDGGRGLCANWLDDGPAICLEGCTSDDDCASPQHCTEIGGLVGGFTGVCSWLCDTVLSDPDGDGPLTSADDAFVECRDGDRCDMPPTTAELPDPDGACRRVCTEDADCGPGTRCAIDSGATEGMCRVPTR